jgi:hypothetical protein
MTDEQPERRHVRKQYQALLHKSRTERLVWMQLRGHTLTPKEREHFMEGLGLVDQPA